MAILDICIFILLLIGILLGSIKGFLRQLATLLGLIIGLVAAKALYGMVAEEWIGKVVDSFTVAQIISFLLIWIGVPILFTLLASLLTRTLEAISLGWLNRLLGALLGALKYLLLASVLIFVFELLDTNNKIVGKTTKSESVLYYPLRDLAGSFIPLAKDVTQQIINM